MSIQLNSDAVALIALIVSLVALLVAFLQVIQQYAATAYDYRRCSRRTMGGWAKYTRRLFVPSEIRFEITFAVPHIGLEYTTPSTEYFFLWIFDFTDFLMVIAERCQYKLEENESSEFPYGFLSSVR